MMRYILVPQALAVFGIAVTIAVRGAPGLAFLVSLGALYLLVEAFEA